MQEARVGVSISDHGGKGLRVRPIMLSLSIGALLALLPAFAVGCQSPAKDLSNAIRSAPPPVQEAYSYAVAHPEVLRYIPCYCGCEASGHTSNEDCFIDQRLPGGTVLYDPMGLG